MIQLLDDKLGDFTDICNMSLRNSLTIAFTFAIGILLKKLGWSLGVLVLYVSLILVFFSGIRNFLKEKNTLNFLSLVLTSLLYLLSILLIQYKIRPDVADGWIAFSSIVIAMSLINWWKKVPAISLTIFPLAINLLAGFMDYRTFHNTFHSVPFEAYIRSKYTYTERGIADNLITKYGNPSKEIAVVFFDKAEKEFQAGNPVKAIEWMNKAIDADPFLSDYYDKRGYYKLSSRTLEMPNVYDALKDFDRAFNLDQSNSSALFHHAQCLSIMNVKEKACLELMEAKRLDPTLDISDLENKSCK